MIRTKKDELYQRLKNAIIAGEYPSDYRFPPENILAEKFGVARNTLRSAFERLEEEHLIERIKSKGTFIKPRNGGRRKILVLTHIVGSAYYPYHYIYPGIKAEAEAAGFAADLCDIKAFSASSAAELPEMITRQDIAGFVVIDSSFCGNEPWLELLKNSGLPVVLAHCEYRDYQMVGYAAAVISDTREPWKAALRELSEAGHRRVVSSSIAYPDGNVRGLLPDELDKIYRELDLDTNPGLHFELETFDETLIESNIRRIFDVPHPPTAVLAYSDFWVPAIYRALKSLNLAVPQDVAVAGFCGMPGGEYLLPPLSTVDLGYEAIGRRAASLIIKADLWFKMPGTVPPCLQENYTILRKDSTAVRRLEYAY